MEGLGKARVPTAVHGAARLSVRGPRKAVAAARLALRVAWIAARTYRNPVRAARAIGRLAAAMRRWTSTTPGRLRRLTSHTCIRTSGRYFWDLYLPGFPSRAFDRSVERELDRVDPIGRPTELQTAIIAITRRCSLACEHCLEGDALNQPEALSSDELHEIVRRIQQRGTGQVFFSGGEPLLRFDDLLSLVTTASAGADVWILTSGLGLSGDRARRLRQAGLTGVAISLDHWDAGAHDRFRGRPGSFQAAERAAVNARAQGLVVALSLCPTRSFVNAGNLRRYAEKARALGAGFIQILEPRSVGRYADREVALDPGQQRQLEAFCERLGTDGDAAWPGVRYLDWSRRSFGCGGAGDRYVYVDTAGDMHACPFCRAPGLGVLGRGLDATIARLQAAGCGAYCQTSISTARTTS